MSRVEVIATFVKTAHRAPMERVNALRTIAGQGIAGDVSADPHSPRHILLTRASVYTQLQISPGDLRENVVVSGDIEEYRSGQLIRIGKDVIVRLTFPCEPCSRLNEVRAGLARDVAARRGMLGRILTSGEIRAGDELELLPSTLAAIPTEPRDRFHSFVERIPPGRVASFADAVRTLGLPRTYVRVMPRFLRDAPATMPRHRMIRESGALISEHVPGQREALQREGVSITPAGSVAAAHRWDTREYFAEDQLPVSYVSSS